MVSPATSKRGSRSVGRSAESIGLAETPVFGFSHFVVDDTIVVGSVPAPFFREILDFMRTDLSDPLFHAQPRGHPRL